MKSRGRSCRTLRTGDAAVAAESWLKASSLPVAMYTRCKRLDTAIASHSFSSSSSSSASSAAFVSSSSSASPLTSSSASYSSASSSKSMSFASTLSTASSSSYHRLPTLIPFSWNRAWLRRSGESLNRQLHISSLLPQEATPQVHHESRNSASSSTDSSSSPSSATSAAANDGAAYRYRRPSVRVPRFLLRQQEAKIIADMKVAAAAKIDLGKARLHLPFVSHSESHALLKSLQRQAKQRLEQGRGYKQQQHPSVHVDHDEALSSANLALMDTAFLSLDSNGIKLPEQVKVMEELKTSKKNRIERTVLASPDSLSPIFSVLKGAQDSGPEGKGEPVFVEAVILRMLQAYPHLLESAHVVNLMRVAHRQGLPLGDAAVECFRFLRDKFPQVAATGAVVSLALPILLDRSLIKELFQVWDQWILSPGCRVDSVLIGQVLRACALSLNHERAFQVYEQFKDNTHLAAREYDRAFRQGALHRQQGSRGFLLQSSQTPLNVLHFTHLIYSTYGSSKAALIPELIAQMHSYQIQPDLFFYTTALYVLSSRPLWNECLQVLNDMSQQGVQADEYCYYYCILAAAYAREGERALALLNEARAQAVLKIPQLYEAALLAAEYSYRLDLTHSILILMHDDKCGMNTKMYHSLQRQAFRTRDWHWSMSLFESVKNSPRFHQNSHVNDCVMMACKEVALLNQMLVAEAAPRQTSSGSHSASSRHFSFVHTRASSMRPSSSAPSSSASSALVNLFRDRGRLRPNMAIAEEMKMQKTVPDVERVSSRMPSAAKSATAHLPRSSSSADPSSADEAARIDTSLSHLYKSHFHQHDHQALGPLGWWLLAQHSLEQFHHFGNIREGYEHARRFQTYSSLASHKLPLTRLPSIESASPRSVFALRIRADQMEEGIAALDLLLHTIHLRHHQSKFPAAMQEPDDSTDKPHTDLRAVPYPVDFPTVDDQLLIECDFADDARRFQRGMLHDGAQQQPHRLLIPFQQDYCVLTPHQIVKEVAHDDLSASIESVDVHQWLHDTIDRVWATMKKMLVPSRQTTPTAILQSSSSSSSASDSAAVSDVRSSATSSFAASTSAVASSSKPSDSKRFLESIVSHLRDVYGIRSRVKASQTQLVVQDNALRYWVEREIALLSKASLPFLQEALLVKCIEHHQRIVRDFFVSVQRFETMKSEFESRADAWMASMNKAIEFWSSAASSFNPAMPAPIVALTNSSSSAADPVTIDPPAVDPRVPVAPPSSSPQLTSEQLDVWAARLHEHDSQQLPVFRNELRALERQLALVQTQLPSYSPPARLSLSSLDASMSQLDACVQRFALWLRRARFEPALAATPTFLLAASASPSSIEEQLLSLFHDFDAVANDGGLRSSEFIAAYQLLMGKDTLMDARASFVRLASRNRVSQRAFVDGLSSSFSRTTRGSVVQNSLQFLTSKFSGVKNALEATLKSEEEIQFSSKLLHVQAAISHKKGRVNIYNEAHVQQLAERYYPMQKKSEEEEEKKREGEEEEKKKSSREEEEVESRVAAKGESDHAMRT